jgi:hypothetical protein
MPKYYRFRCRDCRKDFTVKNGTIFEDSPLGLDKWMIAMWMIANCKNGISSYEVARALGVCQKTAWFMMHRLREAMRTGTFEKMVGTIESDETYIGGLEKNKHFDKKLNAGRGGVGKAIVQGLIERNESGGKSRVKAQVVPNTTALTLQGTLTQQVEPGSTVYTDAPADVPVQPVRPLWQFAFRVGTHHFATY